MTREEMILAHQPRVAAIARVLSRRRFMPGLERRDLLAAGQIGLLEAVDRFKPDQGVTLGTFVSYRIRGAMLDMMRSEYGRKDSNRRIGKPEQKEPEFFEALLSDTSSPESVCARAELLRIVAAAIGHLPRQQRLVMQQHFFNDKELGEIAVTIGLHPTRVTQLRQAALKRLRERLCPLKPHEKT
jgi:RNA polymerase sigma factor for flagellar operon FliA